MTPDYVLDTSVVIKWIRQEEILADQALRLLNEYLAGEIRIAIPALLAYEIANVLRYKPDLTAEHVETALQALFDLALTWIAPTPDLIRESVTVARASEISVYDASFVALADALKATFVTADERLVRHLDDRDDVRFLGDVGTSPER